jgi:hypothetical protein
MRHRSNSSIVDIAFSACCSGVFQEAWAMCVDPGEDFPNDDPGCPNRCTVCCRDSMKAAVLRHD